MNKIWCEVDTNILKQNIKEVEKLCPNKKAIAVLKSNAYGLGIKEMSSAIKDSVDMFAVSTIEEFRQIDSDKDVLIMSPVCRHEDFECTEENLILSVDSINMLHALPRNIKRRVHIFVDTCNYRMGVRADYLEMCVNAIERDFPNIKIEGIYTHFHNCSDIKATLKQINSFKKLVEPYKDKGYLIHCLASSSIANKKLRQACDFTNGYRFGNLLYGFSGANLGIKKCSTFKAKLLHMEDVKKGEYVGFGASYHKVDSDIMIGVLGCGHEHGFGCVREAKDGLVKHTVKGVRNKLKDLVYITCNGKPVSIIGKINMNTTIINLNDFREDTIFTLNMSPILADSSIKKIYK